MVLSLMYCSDFVHCYFLQKMRIGYYRIRDIKVQIESEIQKIEVCLQMPGKPRELEKLKMLRIYRKTFT